MLDQCVVVLCIPLQAGGLSTVTGNTICSLPTRWSLEPRTIYKLIGHACLMHALAQVFTTQCGEANTCEQLCVVCV